MAALFQRSKGKEEGKPLVFSVDDISHYQRSKGKEEHLNTQESQNTGLTLRTLMVSDLHCFQASPAA